MSNSDFIIPETHELLRQEDIDETVAIFTAGNDVLEPLTEEQLEWVKTALQERQTLCGKQYSAGRCDQEVVDRLKELNSQIQSVSPKILKVLHYLSRVRAIIPALIMLKKNMTNIEPDSSQAMVAKMQLDCSKAEMKTVIEGLAKLRVHPEILEKPKTD